MIPNSQETPDFAAGEQDITSDSFDNEYIQEKLLNAQAAIAEALRYQQESAGFINQEMH